MNVKEGGQVRERKVMLEHAAALLTDVDVRHLDSI